MLLLCVVSAVLVWLEHVAGWRNLRETIDITKTIPKATLYPIIILFSRPRGITEKFVDTINQ